MLCNIEHLENSLARNKKEQQQVSNSKKALGGFIKEERLRKKMSQRKLAQLCVSGSNHSLPNSNLKYIEDGVNAPSPQTYNLISQHLALSPEKQYELDRLYSEVRQIPPPDICKIILNNQEINKYLRLLVNQNLTSDDFTKIKECFESIVKNKENNNETV